MPSPQQSMAPNVLKPTRFCIDIFDPFSPRARFVRRHHFRLFLRRRRLILIALFLIFLIISIRQLHFAAPSLGNPPAEKIAEHDVVFHANNEAASSSNSNIELHPLADGAPPHHLLDLSQPNLTAASPPDTLDDTTSDTEAGQVLRLATKPVVKVSVPSSNLPPISAVVLFHSEYPTLNHTLESWEQLGLLNVVSEFVFFLNGMESVDEFYERLPRLKQSQWKGLVRVIASSKNLPLGLAITEMVRIARHDLVLLLEKDWVLIESLTEIQSQLSASVNLLESNTAHLVRFRHRHRPGAPLHARIMHQGREQQMLHQQSNLYCYLHHWVANLSESYSTYFTPCAGSYTSSEPVWCSKARYCQWTNNPGLFYRRWFLDRLGLPFERDYNETVQFDPNSNMLDFEFYANWKEDIWNSQNFVIALPRGLFEHQEVGEQNLMNTVWYAWTRLSTDTEEKRKAYFETEIHECISKKSHEAGIPYNEKYPLEFVRMYHYDRAMNRTIDEAVEELEAKGLQLRRTLEEGRANWRTGVTDLTNLWYKVSLFTYPVEPKDMEIAFVTALFTGTEGTILDSSAIEALATNLKHVRQYKTIVYADKNTVELVSKRLVETYGLSKQQLEGIAFVTGQVDNILSSVLTKQVIRQVIKLRLGEWEARVKARSDGGIPSLTESLFALAKPLLLRSAEQMTRIRAGRIQTESVGQVGTKDEKERLKSWTDVSHFVWMDAESRCVNKSGNGFSHDDLNLRNDHVLRGNMMLNSLVSGQKISTERELEDMLRGSGFDSEVLLQETEVREISAGLELLDGRTMGGSRLAITLMGAYFDVVMRDMLNKGSLGSEREYLTIAFKNVGYNFHFMDSWHACPNHRCADSVDADRGPSFASSRQGCRLFEWAGKCAIDVNGE